MNDEERLEEIEELIAKLAEESLDALIVVEGRKDLHALRSMGVKGEIKMVNVGNAIFNLCEEISAKHERVIILTDWDARGGRLCCALQDGLKACGVIPDIEFRARLAMLTKKGIKDVEGLPGVISFLERRIGGMGRGAERGKAQ
ncbi:MAG: DNA primase [Candidatus Thermoplasmatota archaeon]